MDVNCHVEPIQKISTSDECNNLAVSSFTVWGMSCSNCANRVRNSLLALSGVLEADIDHTTGLAFVEYNPDLVSIPALLQTVAQAGDGDRHKYVGMLLGEASL